MISYGQIDILVDALLKSLRRGEIKGLYNSSREVIYYLREIVNSFKRNESVQNLIETITYFGIKLTEQKPDLLTMGNIVRRVLYIIREEFARYLHKKQLSLKKSLKKQKPTLDRELTFNLKTPTITIFNTDKDSKEIDNSKFFDKLFKTISEKKTSTPKKTCLTQKNDDDDVTSQPKLANLLEMTGEINYNQSITDRCFDLKRVVQEEIQGLIDELETSYLNICENCSDIVHTNEVILTIGLSHTVLYFLAEAAAKKKVFDVIVVEQAPLLKGHNMAIQLSKKGIKTTLITDSAIFAVMSRVNKVILGANAVMADGGIIATHGTKLCAMAAKKHSVPVVVLSGIHKLTPLYPLDQESFNITNNPSEVIPFNDGKYLKNVNILNPVYDYTSPKYIDLYITNHGIHNPNYIYRLLTFFYFSEDYLLENKDDDSDDEFDSDDDDNDNDNDNDSEDREGKIKFESETESESENEENNENENENEDDDDDDENKNENDDDNIES